MEIAEFRRTLRKFIPAEHPLLEDLDSLQFPEDSEDILDPIDQSSNDLYDPLNNLVDIIEDWKRGIRDWFEVERELAIAREELR